MHIKMEYSPLVELKRVLVISTCLPPELKGELGWTKLNYWHTFPIGPEHVSDNCERISYLDVDEHRFIERFEQPRLPVVITEGQLDWQACTKWTMEVRRIEGNVLLL